jgi:hypothetical protein
MKSKLKTRVKKVKNRTRKIKGKKIKGGNNPFSDIFGMWGTMTYNLSNALSVFSVDAPTAYMNQPNRVDPSPSKQFL